MVRAVTVAALALLEGIVSVLSGQQPRLYIQVSDLSSGKPIPGQQLSVNANSTVSGRTDNVGKAEVLLGSEVKPGTSVDLILLPSKYRLFSPWNGRIVVPPFGAGTPISVWLYEEGKRIQIGTLVITTAAERVIDSAVSPAINNQADVRKQQKLAIERIARETRIGEEELESAIKAFSGADPYTLGLLALYRGQYSEAVKNLSSALERARADRTSPERIVKVGMFLGHAHCLAGDYRQAAAAYLQAAEVATSDPDVLNGLAVALARTGDLSGAEAQLRRVVEIRRREGPNSENLALALTNLGFVLQDRQKCEEAEESVLRALEIWTAKVLDVDERLVVANGNVARAKFCRSDYAGAAQYFQRELSGWKRLLGPTPLYAEKLTDYARSMYRASQYDFAEPAFREALAILQEKSVKGSDVIWILRYLGSIRFQAKDYTGAEELYGRALKEQADATGVDSAPQIGIYEALIDVFDAKQDTVAEEHCYIRILAIRDKEPVSSSRDQNIAIVTTNLGILYYNRGEYQRAKPWLEDAARRLDRAFPAGYPGIARVQKALNNIANMNSAERAKPWN